MPTTGPDANPVPTIVLQAGSEPPQYPVLRVAPRAFRLLAALELVAGGVFWMYPATLVGVIPGLLTGLWVAAGAFVLWAAAELCELGLELLYHLRAGGR